ncbi:hypothetical protein BREU_1260 [Bifidobacterium reuteri DSM 23975]|uniref:Uncharacterized protein n=1 Tax=Bifidobacterium reuteri DSM 23975 TaxID=1437610 RepID=A0A087CMI5_9BIFI|nr:hypothetical protein [Bifidobacterium reuteri]KFI84485.1 hypothetical protein BREU_1260 [Bifidobacterium reuteri DSM 23975]
MTTNEDKTPNTRIKYMDGTTDEVCVTMWQRCQAETHAKAKGWGNLMDAAVKFNTYSAYVRCRQIGATTLPFEQWADTVISVEDMTNDAAADSDDTAPAYDGTALLAATPDSNGMADTPDFLSNGTQEATAN